MIFAFAYKWIPGACTLNIASPIFSQHPAHGLRSQSRCESKNSQIGTPNGDAKNP